MHIDYSEPIHRCHFTLKCFPVQDERQKVISCRMELLPQVDYTEGTDGFGNSLIYGNIRQPHSLFSVRVSGKVEIEQTEYETIDTEEPFLFRHPYGMNRSGSSMQAYFEKIRDSLPEGTLEQALAIMHRLHQDLVYEKGCTDANTPAETAFSQGKGVCQDYAHIFIGLCHLNHIPARYVTGLLAGEGESHAWAEVWIDQKWIGLDVTNDMPVNESHIKFGHGRDAADCRLNTGIVYGTATQTQTAIAIVKSSEQ